MPTIDRNKVEQITQEVLSEENWNDCRASITDNVTFATVDDVNSTEPALDIRVKCDDGNEASVSVDMLPERDYGQIKEEIRRSLKARLRR